MNFCILTLSTLNSQSGTEARRYRSGYGNRRQRREQRGGRHDSHGRQLRVDRHGRRGGPHYLRQPEEIDRVHADLQHPGDLAVSVVHDFERAVAAGHHHYPVHRLGHRHGAGHLVRVRGLRKRHHETQAARLEARQARQRSVSEDYANE